MMMFFEPNNFIWYHLAGDGHLNVIITWSATFSSPNSGSLWWYYGTSSARACMYWFPSQLLGWWYQLKNVLAKRTSASKGAEEIKWWTLWMVGYLQTQDFTALAFAPLAILPICDTCIIIHTPNLPSTFWHCTAISKLLQEGKSWGHVCKSTPLT